MQNQQKLDGQCFVFNPEMVLKVQPISLQDRIEYLMMKKRFEETLLLINQQRGEPVPIEQVIKVENVYLEHLLKQKDYDKLEELLPKFICKELDHEYKRV